VGVHDGHRQNMKRRFLETGLNGFADHEALELLLFYAIPRRDTNETAHRLMERYGSLDAVLSAPVEDLQKVDGMGESAALLVHLTRQLCARSALPRPEETVILNSTAKAGRYLLAQFAGKKSEVVLQLCLDRKGKMLGCRQLSEGSVSSAELSIRRLVENALLLSASSVILAHNHPSGVALPSGNDFVTTERAREALEAVSVQLLDHIIVADNDFVSLADSGYLAR